MSFNTYKSSQKTHKSPLNLYLEIRYKSQTVKNP